jgi:hypothetical protein
MTPPGGSNIHRESCTVLAPFARLRKMGCTCDLGHATNDDGPLEQDLDRSTDDG